MNERNPESPPPEGAAEAERVRQRRERIAIGIVAALVLGLTLLEANLATIGGAVGYSANIVIFALININVVLIVLLIFLVTRNVFKLILDRKRNILGARIRSRLVVLFAAFSLIPTILLFIAAATMTTKSIRSWIGGRVGIALTDALEIARKDLDEEARALGERAMTAAPEVEAAIEGGSGHADLSKWIPASDNSLSVLLVRDRRIVRSAGPLDRRLAAEIASRAVPSGGKPVRLVGEEYASGSVALRGGDVLVLARTLPPEDARRIGTIAQAYDEYHQVRLLDDPIRASYIGILILITLLIVFAATWMGIYLARQITEPVQLMAESMRKVAGGDLSVRVDYRSDDEFGYLVESFNRMTGDLREMRRDLEETNTTLSTTYEELMRRNRFIETILTDISTAVVVLDRHGRIAMINRVAEQLLEVSGGSAIGKPYREALREEHFETVRSLSRELGTGGNRQVERQVEIPVGDKRISLRIRMTMLQDEEGGHLGLVVVFDDLSQTMRLQKVLAWREIARRVAHEIRNPLTPIQLSAERLQRKYGAAHAGDPAFDECTQTILSEVATLKLLLDEFTRFSRMPAPTLAEGDLGEELRSTVETFRARYPSIRIEFRSDGASGVRFDVIQMRRALSNLLENAASALGGSGNIGVRCDRIPGTDWIRLSVSDDGPGIAPQDREHLFEPYFSRKEGGTGLGLAIVNAIAIDHGGVVRVRDNEPSGAVFEMEFPAGTGGERSA